jgi:hypothetical protein
VRRWWLVLLAGWGCSSPPLKELPVVEPPPAPAPPEPTGSGPEHPPAPPPAAPRLEGAWSSAEMRGPGSAAYQRIDFVFRGDRSYLGVAQSGQAPVLIFGTYELHGGELVLQGGDGRRRVWACVFDDRRMLLKDGACSLVLDRVR